MKLEHFPDFLTEYFLKYSAITTQGDPKEYSIPTTIGQKVLLDTIRDDLIAWGIKEIRYQDEAILIAKIPKTVEAPPISFMAHVDTADIGVAADVSARVVEFVGEDIVLNKEQNIILRVSEHPEIVNYKNEQIIITDGTSVLGADDKAGVTVMVGLARYLMTNSVEHGDIYLIFVPDEEVGLRGAYAFDIEQLPKDILSYTIDGGPLGEFGYETFNGAGVVISIKGISIHPGSAKGILVNPILVANSIISQLDSKDTPEHSEGKEGFILVTDISGNASDAEIKMIIRDFDQEKFEARKQLLTQIVDHTCQEYPKAHIVLEIKDSYANIANTLSPDSLCIDLVKEAMANLNIPICVQPIRGGTDGAVFSAKRIPTPNIFTGAHDIHSIYEYLPVSAFVKSLETIIQMVMIAPKYRVK
ncbi:MAG: peptidase T [Brevinema sp.]